MRALDKKTKLELCRAIILHTCMRARRLDCEPWRQPLAASVTADWFGADWLDVRASNIGFARAAAGVYA